MEINGIVTKLITLGCIYNYFYNEEYVVNWKRYKSFQTLLTHKKTLPKVEMAYVQIAPGLDFNQITFSSKPLSSNGFISNSITSIRSYNIILPEELNLAPVLTYSL